MTVYYCEEDVRTRALPDFLGAIELPGVTWRWRALPRKALFRAIGLNQAALKHKPKGFVYRMQFDVSPRLH